MITGFVGVPGSGKSYESVKKILENLKLGRKIYTNIDGLQDEHCRVAIQAYCNLTDFQLTVLLNHLDQEQTDEFWLHCEVGSLILIDECHLNFSNREWSSGKNVAFTRWASTHRHFGYDVVLITQDIEKIDKHARSLIEYVYLFSKVNFLGGAVSKKYVCYTYHGDSHKGHPMAKAIRTYDPKIFACYQSYGNQVIKEVGFMKKVNVLNHPIFWSIPVMLLVFCFFGFKSGLFQGKFFGIAKVDLAIKEMPVTGAGSDMPVAPGVLAPVKTQTVSTVENDPKKVISHLYVFKMSDGTTHLSDNNSPPPGGVQVGMM